MTAADQTARDAEVVRAEFGDENLAVLDDVYRAFLAKVDLRALLSWRLPDGMDALMLPVFRAAVLAITGNMRLGELSETLKQHEYLADRVRDLEAESARVRSAVARLKRRADMGPNSTVSLSVWESAQAIEEALGCTIAYEEAN